MQAVLVVSFGTTFDETCKKNILAIEQKITKYKVYRAFTSEMIIKSLKKRDIFIDNVENALDKMKKDGITEVFVLPTHLLYGEEYNKISNKINQKKDEFKTIRLAKPLLADENDCKKVVNAIYLDTKKEKDEAIILMGHGTTHFYNIVYSALNFLATELGFFDIYVTTVEGYPNFDDAVSWAIKNGYKKAILAPLMLVAGDHATNDMASDDENSLKTLFEEKNISIRTIIKGLGEYSEIKELYLEHLEEIF